MKRPTTPPLDDADAGDFHYIAGMRSALTHQLAHILGELGYSGDEGQRLAWILERERAVAKLREVCAEYGDNDWEDNLHLADVIDKHLHRYLEDDDGE
jgi:hypothetical protein